MSQSFSLLKRKFSGIGVIEPETLALILVVSSVCLSFIDPNNSYLNFGSHKISLLSLLLPLITVGSLAIFFVRRNLLKPHFLDLAVMVFMLFFLLRNIMGAENAGAIKFFIYGISLFYLTTITVQKRKAFNSLVLALLLITSLACVYGFIEYAVQNNFLFPSPANRQPKKTIHRLGSILPHPVSFGEVLVQVVPFSLLLLAESRKLWKQAIAITAFLWFGVALLLTFSKGSWIAASFLGGAWFVYLARKGIKKTLPAVIVIALSLVFVFVFWQQIYTDVSVRANFSVTTRYASWEAAASGISVNFITGLGFRQSNAQLHNFFGPEWAGYSVVVENTYLSLFLDEGVFGFCLWMIVLGSLVTAGIKAYRLNLRHRFWVLAALASIAGFAINAFTFDSLFIWPNFVLFWIAAGIIRGVSELDNNLDNDIMSPN